MSERFEADATFEDNVPLVLDHAYVPARVILSCDTDEQAERIAAFLNEEFSPGRVVANKEGE